MKILFLGGDKRQLEIIDSLYHKNNDIDVIGYDNLKLGYDVGRKNLEEINIHDYDIILFPVDGVKDDFSITTPFNKEKITLSSDILVNCKERVLIFTGIKTKRLNDMLKMAQKDVIALMEDNDVKRENSIPTVEGVIGDLVYSTDVTINESSIMVLGYGNIGKLLVSELNHLGAIVTVGIIEEEDYKKLLNDNIKVLYTNDVLAMRKAVNANDIIINTVPNIILNKDYLMSVKKGAYILDIASYPHGVDFDQANKLGIKSKLLMGIPAQVAPKTAGHILTKKINSIMTGGDN